MANTVSRLISDETLNRVIQIESAGNPDAKAPTSSAAGLGQFINATWLGVVRKHRPDLLIGRSEADVCALRRGRATASLQIDMLARFTEANARGIGGGCTDGDLYLAHFLGLGAAQKFFRADANASAEGLAGAAAVAANRSILAGKTAGEVRAWAQRSMEQRWVKAGKPDWISKWYSGTSAPPDVEPIPPKPKPPVPKPPDQKPPVPVKEGVIATVLAAIAAVFARLSDVPWETVIPVAVISVAAVVAGFFIARHRRRSP